MYSETEFKLGPGTLYFDETKVSDSISGFHITKCDEVYYPEPYEPVLTGINSTSLSVELTMSNSFVEMLFPVSPNPHEITLNIPIHIQHRRHKKKRVNKKWAKRYGYRTEYRELTLRDVKVTPNGYSGFELSGIPVKY